MKLTELTATDFLSFKNIKYNFKDGVSLIVGVNDTDEGQESNGSGKSNLQAIIEYCILRSVSKRTIDSQLVRWGETEARISLAIHCPIRQETLLIERKIGAKTGGQAQLSLNGVVKIAYSDNRVSDIDKGILAWIGITGEDLQNFFIMSKSKYTSFFDSSNTKLIALIGRFSNISIIEGVDKDIAKKYKDAETHRTDLALAKRELYGRYAVYDEEITKLRLVDKNLLVSERLKEIDAEIAKHQQSYADGMLSIESEKQRITISMGEFSTIEDKIKSSQVEIDDLNLGLENFASRVAAVEKEMQVITQKRDASETVSNGLAVVLTEIRTTKNDIENNIIGAVICPKCQHRFLVGDPTVNIAEETLLLEEVKNMLEVSLISVETAAKEVDSLLQAIKFKQLDRRVVEGERTVHQAKCDEADRKLQSELKALQRISNENKNSQDWINSRLFQVKQLKIVVEELEQSKSGVSISDFDKTESIADLSAKLVTTNSEIEENAKQDIILNDQANELKRWEAVFQSFTQYLSIKTLKVLQGYANHFLEILKSDLRVQLEGYKVKADGGISDKITVTVIRQGQARAIGNFSGGEHVRMEAAMILTIQHAINMTNPYGGLDFISIDEIFESIDGTGLRNLTTALMEVNRTIQVTTHIPSTMYECNVLIAEKINGITTLKQN